LMAGHGMTSRSHLEGLEGLFRLSYDNFILLCCTMEVIFQH